MTHTPSETHAYAYISNELLQKKGWTREQIFPQQEALNIKSIAEQLVKDKPECVVKISESIFYIIESKNERKKIDKALDEARDYYCDKINKSQKVKAVFASGVAGNDKEGFETHSEYLQNGTWKTITENSFPLTALLSKSQVEKILHSNSSDIREIEISDQEFLKAAETINDILHEGGIDKSARAKVMSSVLLALIEGTDINLDESPTILVKSINSRVDLVLKSHRKPEFARYVNLELPSSEDNHIKYKNAIVKTIQELLGLNIRSAMKSGKDVLGQFYEVFLKYGNGAKEIGIVLTPRHITKFAAEVLDINSHDLVLDPTCGTGGFLVAAFDEVKNKTKGEDFDRFKFYGLYGIESQDSIVSLALVNMIFRGDGKNNIVEGDCFAKWLNVITKNGISAAEYKSEDFKGRIPPITKVLMNPPFPKKKTDYKPYLFIEQALKQMQTGGLLFSVLPYSSMIKTGGYLKWRERLLANNSLLAVITFPEDLFYPVGVHTVGIIIKKGEPQKKTQNVLWVRALHDGLLKKKGKRLPNPREKNDYVNIKEMVKTFLKKPSIAIENILAFQKASPIDYTDKNLELCPEAYLDASKPKLDEIEKIADELVRDSASYLIKLGLEEEYYAKSK